MNEPGVGWVLVGGETAWVESRVVCVCAGCVECKASVVELSDGVLSVTPKARKLADAIVEKGHSNVRVWWEQIGPAAEMCGNSGGWMYSSTTQEEPDYLGLSFDEAVQTIADDRLVLRLSAGAR